MDLVALRIFKAVADAGGITRAAARLNRVQSNVTTRVRQLEAALGTPLFHRHKGRLALSAEGRVLLAYAERLLSLSAEAEQALRGGAPRGTLRIGALESTAAARLPGVLARYHRAHPDVQLELACGTSAGLAARVVSGELEAAFVAQPFNGEGLETLAAFREELVLITPRATGGADRLPVLAFAKGCAYRQRLEAWLARSGRVPERVMEYASYHAIVASVAAGAGMAIVPRSVLQALRREPELEAHPLPRDVADAVTMLVWRAGHRSSALEALKRVLGSSPSAAPSAGRPTPASASRASRSAPRRRSAGRPPRRS